MTQDLPSRRGASPASDIAAFLDRASTLRPGGGKRGGLIFAVDATMSRQPTWDLAQSLNADMVEEAGRIGGLDIQLLYYRGFRECRASGWVSDAAALSRLMSGVRVAGGRTQIGRVLAHARKQASTPGDTRQVRALVFIGDAVEEDVDALCATAGELGLLGLPCLMFQEGRAANAEAAFREIARLSKGAYARFDEGSAAQLRALLSAAARFAAGGRAALAGQSSPAARQLLADLSR